MEEMTKIQQAILSSITHTNKIFQSTEIKDLIIQLGVINKVKSNKKIEYYNIPISFDIETTSFNKGDEKQATMYIWTMCIGGLLIYGRTWKEFKSVINFLSEWFNTSSDKRLIIYVHNLSFEFQFIKNMFKWDKVFALDMRKPVQAVTISGIEFRCSYMLSGYSLKNLGKQLLKYKVEKLEGDLDYSLLRNSKTPLTDKEFQYCLNDVLVVVAYIQELIERLKYIYNIPLTKTGFVRDLSRKYCFYGGVDKRDNNIYHKYKKFIRGLTLDDETYTQLKQAFAGGFTHANPWYADTIVRNVHSFDFTSSYPYVMLSEKFPMTPPKDVIIHSNEELDHNLRNYCCLFDIEVMNIKATTYFENYISESHCREIKGAEVNNGRIVKANHLVLTVTDRDFLLIRVMYKWENMKIYNFKIFGKFYLPTNFVRAILELYSKKTTLKGVEGKEVEYMQSKENLNSMYGMCVTDICRDEIIYSSGKWSKEKPEPLEAISKQNKSARRFLYYPWGVWVTAYARFNLFTAILELKNDYVYSDTDSVKFINFENHKDYFNKYNSKVLEKLKISMKTHGFNFELTCPKNIDGEVKQIGIWDYEGCYSRFKTLGAKRYMTERDGKISITVSGLNKEITVKYLQNKYGDRIFEEFTNDLYIPAEFTGKNIHTYIDNSQSGYLTDYLGNKCEYYELSSVHLESAEYNLSIADAYARYLLGIKEISVN